MRVLVIGSGAREHALAWRFSTDPAVSAVLAAPGSDAMADVATCHPAAASDGAALAALAVREKVDLAVVGPEAPLVAGVADDLRAAGIAVFGPGRDAAQLEGSKAFSKAFMQRHAIPTAGFVTVTDPAGALAALDRFAAPYVLKASGLASGKGVVIAPDRATAEAEVAGMLAGRFGDASRELVIEEFMDGEEASVFAVCDGARFVLLPAAQDHKRALDGDQGPNTGGMGAYAPASIVTPDILDQVGREIVAPTLAGMAAEGMPFVGVLFVGLMLAAGRARVVEFNVRFGDPECEVLMPLMGDGLAAALRDAATGQLDPGRFPPVLPGFCAAVILAPHAYPGPGGAGARIGGLEAAAAVTGARVFHAGSRRSREGGFEATGGRTLAVSAHGASVREAVDRAYGAVARIEAPGLFHRTDIGWRELAREG